MAMDTLNTKDMTQGSPFKLILTFSMPLMLGNVFQQLYTFVDALIVGQKIGAYALATLGATEWLVFIMFGVIQGIAQGCSVVIAQYFGNQRIDLVQKSIFNSFLIWGIGAVCFTFVGQVIIYPGLMLLQTPSEILELAHVYLKILYWGIPITFLYNVLAAILRALGNSKIPLIAMVISSISNIVLDVFLVIYMEMGISGAAYGTVLAQVLAVFYCVYKIRKIEVCRLDKWNKVFCKYILLEQIKIGTPMGMQSIITSIGGLIVQAKANTFGILFITGYSAANKLYALLEIAASSYAQGILTYTAQNNGVGNKVRIKNGLFVALKIGIITAAIMSCVMLFAGKNILGLFIKDIEVLVSEAIHIGYDFLKVLAWGFPLLYFLYIIRACVQGLGNTVFPMMSSFMQVLIRGLCAVVLTSFIGSRGIFWGEILAWVGADIFLVIVFVYYYKKIEGNSKYENKN